MKQNQSFYKIYSRKRLRILQPQFDKRKEKNKRIFYSFVAIFIIIILLANLYKAVMPIFETLCSDEAISIATKITNEETAKVMANYSYKDLFTIEKDENRKYTNDKCKYFNNRWNYI